mmetsp:Transcript_1930/g.5427  ORF Transcript_1930/g.5427 Transcript_1930/m.5427 type:complete len:308 (-) Transcript_1930:191-1114(-)
MAAFRAGSRGVLATLLVALAAAVLAATSVQGNKERDIILSLLDEARRGGQLKAQLAPTDSFANLDEVTVLGKDIMRAFGPILADEGGVAANETAARAMPNFRFLAYTTGEEEEGERARDNRNRNLLQEDDAAAGKEEAEAEAAGAHLEAVSDWASSNPAVSAWVNLFHKVMDRWPIWVEGIYMRRGSSLGGGTCSFDFESHKNWKYLPLQWKMTNADCRRFGKTDIRNATNRWCVKFKLFEHVTFTHCAPSQYWQLLVSGQIISVNPANGATQIDVLPLIQSGGLDQFLPLRSAFGQSGLLDVLNYL